MIVVSVVEISSCALQIGKDAKSQIIFVIFPLKKIPLVNYDLKREKFTEENARGFRHPNHFDK